MVVQALVTDPRRRRLAIMAAVQSALVEVTDVEQLFQMLHTQLDRVLDASGLILGLHDETSHMVDVVGQVESGVFLPGGSFPLGNGFLSEVIRTRQPRHIRRWSAEGPRVQVQYATGTPGLPESTVTVPLLIGSRVIGVLSVQSHAPDAYDEDDAFLLQALSAQIASAVDAFQQDHAIKAVQRVSKLEAVLASMQDGLLIVDRDGSIVSLNPPARAIFGPMGAGIILGQALDREEWGNWPLGAKAVAEALAPVVEALQRGEAQRDVEVELNAQGRRVLSFSSAPISDASGLAGGVIVIRDVTTERDVARLRDDLLSIAAHDLRTPATVLRLQAQMMQRDVSRNPELPDSWSDRVQTILDQTDRLSNMLNLLLDLSRVEAGRVDLRLERADIMQLIRQLSASIQSLTTIHSIKLHGPQRLEGSPGADPYVITVGAEDDNATAPVGDDVLAWFSSYGTPVGSTAKPDLVAPGRKIVSLRAPGSSLDLALPDRVVKASNGSTYFRLSGTSMATAVVSGVAALVLQQSPGLTPDQLKAVLMGTARPFGQSSGVQPNPAAIGAGLVDAYAATFAGRMGPANRGRRPADPSARSLYPALRGQPLSWLNPTLNGVQWSLLTWDNIVWDNIAWDNLAWDNIAWDNLAWDNLAWDNLAWDSSKWNNLAWDNLAWDSQSID